MFTNDAYNKMVRSIRRSVSKDYRRDVVTHGADTGVPGFTYYHDTVRFYRRHQEAIWALLCEEAEDYGAKNVYEFMAGFNDSHMPSDYDQMANQLAWYALETVCRREFPDL